MRRFVLAASLLALAACGQPPASDPQTAQATDTATPAKIHATGAVEGWQTDQVAYARLGNTAPNFTGKQVGDAELTQDQLRDRWTIITFLNAADAASDEMRYVTALNSAADQDPDLDFLSVAVGGQNPKGLAWPVLIDDGKIAEAFRIEKTPAYVLIGPDLTIEGYRGALTATPDDGIKSVIRGVAQIRKQIASPE